MAECPECEADVALTISGRLRSHGKPDKCPGSGARTEEMPPPCPQESAPGTRPDTASSATCSKTSDTGGHQSGSPGRSTTSSGTPTTTTAPEIPGAVEYVKEMARAAEFDRPRPVFDRPRKPQRLGSTKPVIPMEGKAAEIAGRLKEMFHAYSNRMDRNQQATMGPSEIGTPCDRRIGMSLLRLPPVNPGGDGWASFVGTQIHRGLEDMFVWANAGSGRYQTEVKLQFPNAFVPHGTTDLVDTALMLAGDHKAMGSWSLLKLSTQGPSLTYRTQVHTYGYGLRLRGFDIKDVAIIGWPREKSTLDDLYVWTEPYDPSIARKALARVENIASLILQEPGEVAELMGPAMDPYELDIDPSDCRFCPFYLKGAPKSGEGVCNGRE